MKRRNFIKTTGAALSVPLVLNGLNVQGMPKSSLFSSMNETDKILVLIRLNGGNDGLNMVIPRDQYLGLNAVRSNIILPENDVLTLTDTVGLHSQMTALQNVYNDGQLGVVQAVGYPNQNRSHFRSTDIWTSGSPANEFWTTGWLGRNFEMDHPEFPSNYPNDDFPDPFALTIGKTVSQTCQGTSSNFSMTLTDPFTLMPLTEGAESDLPDNYYGQELAFLRVAIRQSNAYGDTITAAADLGSNAVDYPEDNELAAKLKTVALLIAGGLQTKVYVIDLGGFDTHANQVVGDDTNTGNHAELMKTLSDAIASFQADLNAPALDENVIGMTFSEFGRRIRSNESLGTDHGTAGPLFLFGSCVSSSILGNNPEISTEATAGEGVAMQYDFRDIYGSILKDWFLLDDSKIRELLYEDYTHLPIIENCTVGTEDIKEEFDVVMNTYPNPVRNTLHVDFESSGGWVKLSIYDVIGSEIKVVFNKKLPKGKHQIQVDMHDLPAGSYYCRLQMAVAQKTKRIVVM